MKPLARIIAWVVVRLFKRYSELLKEAFKAEGHYMSTIPRRWKA